MPELPEIAHTKAFLDATVLKKEIVGVEFPEKKLLQAPEKEFKKALFKKDFISTRQFGKYLFIEITGGNWLVLHFGMTGKFEYYRHDEHPKHSHLILDFKDSSHLAFVCPRKLGKIYLANGVEDFRQEHSLGQDALELSQEGFLQLLQKKKGSIKSALTDQHLIAGIGNVYADEILFQSKIHPKSKTEKLSEKQQKLLYKQIHKVLTTAIKNEGKRAELPSDYLTPHRKEGGDCPTCSGTIEMLKISGRSTYFCPFCQKER